MNNFQLVKNTEWQEVEINGEDKEIPIGWNVESLEKLCVKIKDGTHGSFKDYEGIDFELLLSAKNIKNNELRISENERKISKNDYNEIIKNGFPKKNDVLMTIVGTIGELMIWSKDKPEAFQRSVSFLRVGEKLVNSFLYFCLKTNYVKEEIGVRTKVGAQPGIYLGDLKAIEIKFPSIQTQSSIASILSHQESIIQDIESLISKYESRFQYLSDELLSGRLRVKEVDGQTILYKNPEDNWKEVEINGEIKEIPKDWEVEKLKNKSKIHSGGTPSKKEGYYGGNIPWITTTDLNFSYIEKTEKNITELGLKNSSAKLIQKNTVLLAMYGASIGKLGISSKQSTTNQSIACIIPNNDFDHKFLFLYFLENKEKIANMGCGNGQPNISQEILKELDIYFPNNLEQKLIANILNQQEELVNKQKELISKEKQKFDWLLDNLLSGKYLVEEIQ